MIVQNGLVAIRRIPPRSKMMTIHGTEYLFRIQHNISLCWVREEDANAVLAIRQGCCGGAKRPVFHLADEDHVRRWTDGGR
jgi:hypothetical protein